MKAICILICLTIGVTINAQTPGEQIANRIANKMKDTLQLSDSQRVQIYQINLQLNQQKANLRTQYTNIDSLRIKIQLVENNRDALYHDILSEEKYYLYLQKKRNLVNNN
jgi:hypothetical protein